MSLQDVQLFYERIATDVELRTKIQAVTSKEECSQRVREAGFDFTEDEFETYTRQLLELQFSDGELKDLNEQELEAVIGGLARLYPPRIVPLYGVIWPPYEVVPLYGVVLPPD